MHAILKYIKHEIFDMMTVMKKIRKELNSELTVWLLNFLGDTTFQ